MTSDTPVITVVGSTSKQGHSVAKSLLATGDYTVRALTRNPNGAKRLAGCGAVLVAGDAGNEADLRGAFAGAWGVFAMTFVHAVTGTQVAAIEEEFALGKLQPDAAAAEGVDVFVFSTLEDVESRTQGKYKAPLFTAKARVRAYTLKTHPRLTSIFPSFGMFYTNWVGSYPPTRAADGALEFTLPMDGSLRQPYIDPVRSPGRAVVALFRAPERYRGQFVSVYDELLTPDEMVETFSHVTGIRARFVRSTRDKWFNRLSRLPAPTVEALMDVYKYQEENGYYAPERDIELARELNPEPSTYANFLQTSGFTGTQDLEAIRRRLDA